MTSTALEKEKAVGKGGRRVALWVATAFLILAQGLAVLLFLRHGWQALSFPYPLNYGEGPLLDQSVRLAAFENIYRTDLSAPPYVIANYPPLFMVAQVPFVWLFGPAMWYGRLISLLSVAAVALFVGLTLHALTRDRLASLAGALIFPAMPYVVRWSSLSRVDSLGLALSWAGLFVVARWPQKRWSVFVSALLLVAAVYTRQTYILAAPLAAFVWLAAQGQRRRALQTAAIAGGACLLLFAALNISTGEGFFLNTVTANLNDFRWERVSLNALGALLACPVLLLSSLAFLLLTPRKGNNAWWLVAPYLIASIPTAVLVGKVGSDVNYLLELSAALGLATGAFIAWQRRRPRLAHSPHRAPGSPDARAHAVVAGRLGPSKLRHRPEGRGRAAIEDGRRHERAGAHGRLHGALAGEGEEDLLPALRDDPARPRRRLGPASLRREHRQREVSPHHDLESPLRQGDKTGQVDPTYARGDTQPLREARPHRRHGDIPSEGVGRHVMDRRDAS